MGETIRFGGQPSTTPALMTTDDALAALLGELSWKYVKQEAEIR
jgi:hypothetical protein